MPSISLDGFSPLKRYENFYLWLALGLAIQGTRGQGRQGDKENNESPIPNLQFPILLYERLRQRLRSVQVPNPQSPIPNPQSPITVCQLGYKSLRDDRYKPG
ncbi:hypothetical protein CDG77_00205 [Nostoc sp. 'Peltigera membranacea cyanobiont' 213]|uniref:hypothetical protein n=1 Tax=Nostoc sp. 'Peltigera membranacea cyanobiont' 213 TaxID=2014530 RepID=UPI000B953896|nr:hypothetical protein [Nostoc sp. 'Peltigera membranacea cyanobiont' 213]OYD99602.1 hypothetical protein CDG77_00205 [Nostoc sp. 'Peltigera membranacea cyanobiont' 213]